MKKTTSKEKQFNTVTMTLNCSDILLLREAFFFDLGTVFRDLRNRRKWKTSRYRLGEEEAYKLYHYFNAVFDASTQRIEGEDEVEIENPSTYINISAELQFKFKDLESIHYILGECIQYTLYDMKNSTFKGNFNDYPLYLIENFGYGTRGITLKDLINLFNKFKQVLFMEANFDGENLELIEDLIALDIFQAEASFCFKNITQINKLYLQTQERKNFPDLDHVEYIEALYLRNNEISDISKVSHLTSLKVLDLANNYITDLKPLENLIHLEELYLESNHIYDLSPLKNLKNLKVLNLSNNLIVELELLEGLDKLEVLCLENNKIEHYYDVLYLKSIKKLNLNDNNIQSFKPLSYENKKSSLLSLSLKNNKIFDIEFDSYEEMGENVLEELIISNIGLENTDFLKDLPKLKKLDISKNRIRNIHYLNELTELEELEFSWNKIKEVEWFENIKPVNELDVIKSLKQLKYINEDEKSEFLEKVKEKEMLFKNFKKAGIHKEKIRVLMGLYGTEILKELQDLGFSKTQIADLTNMSLEEVEYDLGYVEKKNV